MIIVKPLEKELHEDYSVYVAQHPQARFGHDLEWAQTLRETYSVHAEHLVALDGAKVVGICPLFLGKPLTGGRYYQTSVFPSYFGPLYDSDEVFEAILDALIEKAADAQYAEILAPEALSENPRLPFKEQLDFTYKLSLEQGADAAYAKFRRNYKRILRDPDSSADMEIVVDAKGELISEFYRLYADLYARKHGFLPHPEELFYTIFKYYRNATARIYMAKRGDRYIGGIFTFWIHGEVYCGWSALDLKTELQPTHHLIWRLIQDGAAQKFRWFNHGEAEKHNENLKLFKQGWGMEPSFPARYFIPGRLAQPIPRLFDRVSWTKKIISALPSRLTSKALSPLIRFFL